MLLPTAFASPIRVQSVAPLALEMPLGRAVATPMAAINSLVSLMVRVRDEDGVEGWGEIWCNFPRFGIRHRARLLTDVFAPAIEGRSFASPADAWAAMSAFSNVLRLQSGESGPIAAVIAGIDIALWDIAAKRARQPLWRLLGGASAQVPVYASIGRADDTAEVVERCLREGFRAFKVHSAGTLAEHLAAVRAVRAQVGDACEVMLDVNASWDAEAAIATIGQLAGARLSWLEEPIPVDAPAATWRRLAEAAPMPLAGGENMLSRATFDEALAAGVLAVVQPDITKWGGFSGTLPLARSVAAAGRRFCPHMFSGAPGVLASAHVLAASGCDNGVLEYPVGRHPARELLLGQPVRDGMLALGEAPGLGLDVDPAALAAYRVEV
jgi:L-alanine-DL-glutamate epimerase-like enolase superfamily enzyme